ncbi:MAG TPA: ABC transporter permease [Bacteroidota bacterium]|nr:ABC transporter permease [Bacteroidota bacterium]
MSKITSVAKWEYLEKVKSKAFLIGLFLTPMLMVIMGVLPSLFMAQEDTTTKVVGVIDPTGNLAGPLIREMESRYQLANGQPNYLVRPLAVGKGINVPSAVSDADRLAVSDEIEGYCVIGGGGNGDSVAEYRSKAIGDLRLIGRLEETLKSVMTEQKAMTLGISPAVVKELTVKLDLRPVKLSKAGEEEGGFERVFFSAYVFLMALFLLIITSGQMLVRSILEEKSNRIVEVLVSSCSSTELMAGKVLGLSALGLTQMGFWAIIGVAVTIQFGVSLVTPGVAALMVVYFTLGYLFYAAVFIGAGSPLTTEQEAQQVTSYLVMLLIVPIALAFPAMKNPDATWLKVLTFIPFLTPTMMALRIPIQMPALWEILATVLLMIVCIGLAMVGAGRVFRIGILSTGKSPKLAEIFRWAIKG